MKTKNSKAMLICSVFNVIILLLTLLFGENIWRQVHEHEQSVDDLLQEAEQAFIREDYLSALEIYLDDSLKRNPIALNNLGYMLVTGTGTSKDIKRGLDYYEQAAKLGNSVALDNYVLTILQKPTTYDEIIDTLIWGHKEGSIIADAFVERLSMHPAIVEIYGNLSLDNIWTSPYHDWRIWLDKITVEDSVILKDDLLRGEKGDFVGELCYRDIQVLIGYRTEKSLDGKTVEQPVYGTTQELAYRTYRLDYVEDPLFNQTFFTLDVP